MAKSKNHTNHNQNKKAHKNGIKRAKTNYRKSLKGVDPKFRRNQKFVKAGIARVAAEAKAAA
ncbi:60S ribosomal protein L29 [Tulasnella sp. 419]|nr:60S ribosomal protein L29 [Tulasnella sp. 418]KAG8942247.1 60S ribosomal protein L29 [Tulasnella sp. 419]